MPVAEARAMLMGSVRPAWCEHDPQADLRQLKATAGMLQQFSPITGLMPVEPADAVLLDISGCDHLFGGETALAERVLKETASLGLKAAAAIANTPAAAWAVARLGEKPIAVIPSDDAAAFDALPLEALRLTSKCLEKLTSLGLRTIGELRALPREAIPSRFGKELLTRLDQLDGSLQELFTPERLIEPITAAWTSEEPLQDFQFLEVIWNDLLLQLLDDLSGQRLGIRELEAVHRTEDRQEITLGLRLHRTSFDAKHLLELLTLQRERRPVPPGVVWVQLQVTVPGREFQRQVTLFEDTSDVAARALPDFLDRLTSRLGAEVVLRPCLRPTPQPEFVQALLSLAESPLDISSPVTAGDLRERAWARCRPLRLLNEPEAILIAGDRSFQWRGGRLRFVRFDRPERIESGWQRKHDVRRDYYRAQTEEGAWMWIYRCAATGRWFLHGFFD